MQLNRIAIRKNSAETCLVTSEYRGIFCPEFPVLMISWAVNPLSLKCLLLPQQTDFRRDNAAVHDNESGSKERTVQKPLLLY